MLPIDNMKHKSCFNRALLAKAIAAALLTNAGMASSWAQETDKNQDAATEQVERIAVKGYVGSLVSSLNDKRFSNKIQDGIAAEDIGKFPDQNVAESLQRITGVTIDRSEGEGQKVSIRGFGPEFNTSLLNMRTLPSDGTGRSFSYDVIASELISGAEVFKTSTADLIEGGIGGTVNIRTAKPLDSGEDVFVASAKGVYDTLAESENPYLSALISRNFNDKFGILASVTYQERAARVDSVETGGYVKNAVILGNDPYGAYTKDTYWRPQSASQTYKTEDRQRIGGTLALQWSPSDSTLLTVDALHTRLSEDENTSQLQRYFSQPMYNAEVDSNGTVVAFDRIAKPQVKPGVYELWDNGFQNGIGQWNSVNLISVDRESTTSMLGLNFDWKLTDDKTLVFDVQSSSADLDSPNNPAFTLANPSQVATHFELAGDTFNWSGTDDEFKGNASDYMANNMYLYTDKAKDDITEARLDFNWQLENTGIISALNAGVYYADREKISQRYESPWNEVTVALRGFYINIPEQYLTSISPSGGFLSEHDSGGLINSWYSYDVNAIMDYVMSDAVFENAQLKADQLQHSIDNGSGQTFDKNLVANTIKAIQLAQATGFAPVLRTDKSWKVAEQNMAAYVSADIDTEIAERALTGNVGVRYIRSSLDSWGQGASFVGLQYDQVQGSATAVTNSGVALSAANTYSELLPSLNLSLALLDDVTARFAYSKTMTRPDLDDVSPTVSITNNSVGVLDFNNVDFLGYISGDNPELKPYTSQNVDLSLEWYYEQDSYAGVSLFFKDINDWIVTATYTDYLYDTLHNVEREFARSSPLNSESATARGAELALLHTFDSGFGAQLNYTYMDSSAAFDLNNTSYVFSLDGLSKNSYNLIGFYEQDGLQARIAYNWRGSYTECAACSLSSQPVMVEDYGQVDASISYDIQDNLTLTADVINLLGEDPRKYSIYKSRFLSLADTGSRYSIGIRARF